MEHNSHNKLCKTTRSFPATFLHPEPARFSVRPSNPPYELPFPYYYKYLRWSPYFVGVIKTRTMGRLGNVARTDEKNPYSANSSMTYFFRISHTVFCRLNLKHVFHSHLNTFPPNSSPVCCCRTLH
jgi:hypothetical protein